MEFLKDLLIILAVTLGVGVPLRRLGIPVIAGFIIAGVLIGPHLLSIVDGPEQVETLAEIGVALLLFTIGLEVSFDKLRRMSKTVFLGGGFQVAATILATFAIAKLVGFSTKHSIFLGFLLALSSTAIVLRGLQSKGQLQSPYGQFSLAVLIFQDLCVIPIMLAVPLLTETGSAPFGESILSFGKAIVLCGLLLIVGKFVVPQVLGLVARIRERELFLISVLVICLTVSLITHALGASFALGAFLAGMIVSGTRFREQAMLDLLPFREVFVSLFFVSLGMFFDPRVFLHSTSAVGMMFMAIIVMKAFFMFLAAFMMKLPVRAALISSLIMAQVGEFSFIVAESGLELAIIERSQFEIFLAAAIPTMLLTPLVMNFSPRLVASIGQLRWFNELLKIRGIDEIPEVSGALKNHVIIAGYGIAGAKVAERVGDKEQFVILDTNVKNVEQGAKSGLPIYFGDATREEVLSRLALDRAKMLVVTVNDADATVRAVRNAKKLNPDLHILVRGQYEIDRPILQKAGADEIVIAEMEAADKVANAVKVICES